MSWFWRLARYGYSCYFMLVGIAVLLRQAGVISLPKLEPAPGAVAFLDAMVATGYVVELLSITFIIGAVSMLRHRSAPLGIAILAPSVVGIFLFHVVLSQRYLWGLVWMIWLVALAWHYRKAFEALWHYDANKLAEKQGNQP
jgi:hypothetical protein